jgi:hypothetical protein
MKKIGSTEASRIFASCRISPFEDFHALPSSKIDMLLEHADRVKYRKPKDANGSRARYFHAYLYRALGRDED